MHIGCIMHLIPPNELVFMDFETNRGGCDGFPIQVGACLSDGRVYESLILPPRGEDFSTRTSIQVHGIQNDFLQANGRSPRLVAEELYEFGRGRIFTSDHVLDEAWMRKLFDAAELSFLKQAYIPMSDLVDVEHAEECIKAREEVNKIFCKTHAALDDAIYTMREYEIYYDLVSNKLAHSSSASLDSNVGLSVSQY